MATKTTTRNQTTGP